MNAPVELTPAHDGARVLYRHWMSTQPPMEGFVREFSADKSLVRISRTNEETDPGQWLRSRETRVDAVLEASKAPKVKRESEYSGGMQ